MDITLCGEVEKGDAETFENALIETKQMKTKLTEELSLFYFILIFYKLGIRVYYRFRFPHVKQSQS